MSCFSCWKSFSKRQHRTASKENAEKSPEPKKQKPGEEINVENIAAQAFTFREMCTATKNFRQECLLGEGGFGRTFKGTIASTGQVVAVKQLDRSGLQGNKEFLDEVRMLSLIDHPNLVKLVGYCADGDQRLLVYEFMAGGCLHNHLFDVPPDRKPLDWYARMKIALGTAYGLEYLHHKANPPVVYGDMKPTNILLDENSNPRLSDFGLAKLSSSDKMHFSSKIMGTYGYSAPEYTRGGELTVKSDVYSFGVILLELITGRRSIDPLKPIDEQNLVAWAQPIFRDPKRFPDMVDPVIDRNFPGKDLNQVVAMAAMCLQEEAETRPLIGDVVTALSYLSMLPQAKMPSPSPPSTPPKETDNSEPQNHEGAESSDSDMSTRSSTDRSVSSGHSKCSERMRNRDDDSQKGNSFNESNHGNVSSNRRDQTYHNPSLSKKNSKEGLVSITEKAEKCNNDNYDSHDRTRSRSYSDIILGGKTDSDDNR